MMTNLVIFFSTIDGLAFLLLDRVYEGMEFLKQTNTPEENELLNYFDITYVNVVHLRELVRWYEYKIKKN